MNLWYPTERSEFVSSTPSTPVKALRSHLTRNRSDYSLPSSPKLLPRCQSESKFPLMPVDMMVDQDVPRLMSTASSPTPSLERLRVPEEESCGILRQQQSMAPPVTKHVTWGGATTTIRATYRFSNSFGRSNSRNSASAASGSASPTLGSHSSPPSPRYRTRNSVMSSLTQQ